MQLVQPPIVLIKHVSNDKGGPETVSITKQIVADLNEARLHIRPDQTRALDTSSTELPKNLADTTAQVEKDIPRPRDTKPEDDLLITGVFIVVEAEEAPAADTGMARKTPGLFSLGDCQPAISALAGSFRIWEPLLIRNGRPVAYHAQDMSVDFLPRNIAICPKQVPHRAYVRRKFRDISPPLGRNNVHGAGDDGRKGQETHGLYERSSTEKGSELPAGNG